MLVDPAGTLAAGMQALEEQGRLLAADAANANTPGFQPVVLDVGQAIALEQNGLPAADATRRLQLAQGPNGNGVSGDQLLVDLSENQQWFAADAKLAQLAYQRAQTALTAPPA